jgi:2'-5' RNA ligase
MTDAALRIFVAVPLAPGLHHGIATLERRLESAGVAAKWIRPENLHFTLRFLGSITPAQLTRVRRAAHDAVQGVAVFAIHLVGVGAFPSPRKPQVVWVGVREGKEKLQLLAQRLDDALARERFAKEPRSFQAHLTLARNKDPRLGRSLEAAMASLGDVEVGEQSVRSIVVMESLLRPSGALYVQVEEVPLSGHEK